VEAIKALLDYRAAHQLQKIALRLPPTKCATHAFLLGPEPATLGLDRECAMNTRPRNNARHFT
jgi:hypothetical protein